MNSAVHSESRNYHEAIKTDMKDIVKWKNGYIDVESIKLTHFDAPLENDEDKCISRGACDKKVLRVIALEYDGYTKVKKLFKNGKFSIEYAGIFPDVVKSIALSINASIKWVSSRDGNYGSYNKENQTWNGAIQDLIDHVADLAFLHFTQHRNEIVDFSIPIIPSKYVFMVSKEPYLALDIYLGPFHWLTWVTLLMIILGIIPILSTVAKMRKEEHSNEFTISKSFIFVFGAFAAVSCRRWSTTPANISGRYFTILLVSGNPRVFISESFSLLFSLLAVWSTGSGKPL